MTPRSGTVTKRALFLFPSHAAIAAALVAHSIDNRRELRAALTEIKGIERGQEGPAV